MAKIENKETMGEVTIFNVVNKKEILKKAGLEEVEFYVAYLVADLRKISYNGAEFYVIEGNFAKSEKTFRISLSKSQYDSFEFEKYEGTQQCIKVFIGQLIENRKFGYVQNGEAKEYKTNSNYIIEKVICMGIENNDYESVTKSVNEKLQKDSKDANTFRKIKGYDYDPLSATEQDVEIYLRICLS